MSPVDVECVECHQRFAVSISRSDQERERCPRCGKEEMLLAALAGEDTRWYWGYDARAMTSQSSPGGAGGSPCGVGGADCRHNLGELGAVDSPMRP